MAIFDIVDREEAKPAVAAPWPVALAEQAGRSGGKAVNFLYMGLFLTFEKKGQED